MQSAEDFLATGAKFQLGFLDTEKPHPKTRELSSLAVESLPKAISILADIDVAALNVVAERLPSIFEMRRQIEQTWHAGRRVFLCGCGATGRLSLALEYLHRERMATAGPQLADRVIGFMAGGDTALVHSLEGFEDFPEYGARHLRELGFQDGDLLISCTEGGETPYVIGATEEAAQLSTRAPYFLYCNPDDILCEHVERSRRVIKNAKIQKINLTVGPMALAGSTRMQASTVLQAAVGLALLSANSDGDFAASAQAMLERLQQYLSREAARFLPLFIERESAEYKAGRYVMYGVNTYPITVFTDTTERAPTFSLTPFSHRHAERLLKLKPSLCYIYLPETKTAAQAWEMLLHRKPRTLNWTDIDNRTEAKYLAEFNFCEKGAREFRAWRTGGGEHSDFLIGRQVGAGGGLSGSTGLSGTRKAGLFWDFQDIQRALFLPEDLQPFDSLFAHLLLKMFLNIHSTLIMGRLGRYKRNLMTWVYPTNGKLIDRATRYARTLLAEDGVDVSYEQTVRALFDVKTKISANDSVVLATYEYLKNGR